ncbi:LacI family DNA-binding transcriptional regulator [Pantoea sp. BAV 3049]|uniref:LacI family DNA-binding transcriptional regulator n=1 Tax=Pantoea sp. BAV 3049 TaxID=2654188 RepID=UPI00131D00DF|nr:LacI family DNA-binding transcriptional regulator [Pantoea sp. BAV 3049]
MTTILEVAKKAGVSKATVSRVLSGNGYVSEETKARVFSAIQDTGYRPNLLARNLATKSTQTLGLVVTNTLYSGNYFSEILFHSARLMEQHGRQLILADGKHSAEEERAAIDFLLDLRCDGIIIYPRFLTIAEMDEIIARHKQPIMVINRQLRANQSYCIYSDQKGSGQLAVDYLLEQGHRDIAFITGSLDSPTGVERLSGYKTALAKHGIPLREELIVNGKWTAQSGMEAATKLLAGGAPFSALVASNDDMAVGALKALAEQGVRVPGQVSLIGFDDIALAPFTQPSLTTMKVPLTEMMKETIDRLVAMLDGGELKPRTDFSASLVLRDSVAPGPFSQQ